MPIYNWLGGAEVSHATGEQYKEKVIEFLELDGFIRIATSSEVAMPFDLIFRKPEAEGKTDIYVETKYDDISLSDKDFLTEYAKDFIEYNSNLVEPFDMYIFVRKCKNLSKWKQIFSANSYNESVCSQFFNKLLDNTQLSEEKRQKLKETNFENIKKFISDTYVHQMNYEKLLMNIEQKKKVVNSQWRGFEFYLRELPPIRQKQKIFGNFVEVKNYSGIIYSCQIRANVNRKVIYDLVKRYEPIYLKRDMLYSLEIIDERLKKYLKPETIRLSNVKDWLINNPDRLFILKTLFKKYILSIGVLQGGCNYVYNKGDILFFPHLDYGQDLGKIEGKQVTRLFKATKNPFVRHEAIQIEVKIYDGCLFIFFNPLVLFSDNNRKIISGKSVKRLHNKFSPNKYDNNLSIFGDMKWWFEFLCGKRETQLETSDLFCLTGELKPPSDSKTRDLIAITKRMDDFF